MTTELCRGIPTGTGHPTEVSGGLTALKKGSSLRPGSLAESGQCRNSGSGKDFCGELKNLSGSQEIWQPSLSGSSCIYFIRNYFMFLT